MYYKYYTNKCYTYMVTNNIGSNFDDMVGYTLKF